MDYGQAEETVFAQIKGAHKTVTEGKCLFFIHGIVLHFHGCLPVAHHLHYPTLAGSKLNEECRVVLHSPNDSLPQGLGVGINGECEAHWGVVQRRGGILHAVEIYTRLRVCERC